MMDFKSQEKFNIKSCPETSDFLETSDQAFDFTDDEFTIEEKRLAAELQSHCTPWGAEKNISKSSPILMDMGKLYLARARKSRRMKQKLAFIKSATLLAGARVRYERLANASKTAEAREAFHDMGNELLESFNANFKKREILLELSDQTVEKLHPFREDINKSVREDLIPISNYLTESEYVQEQKRKIEVIRNLATDCTGIYKAMIKGVSQCCMKILGSPPCKFTLVGLGSLSRGEVTLYSDFEHVILLEESAKDNHAKLNEIKEYFRWYSVVFQVIVIGMGETRIPSIGIKSLNDLYSEEKGKNWFFDAVTPGGISFDGRFPHASKTPLGRHRPTKNQEEVELIQTVNDMLKFLEKEDARNGYHLRDMLLRPCFVDGDGKVFSKFEKGVCDFLKGKNHLAFAKEQLKFVAEDKYFYMNKKDHPRFYEFQKIKEVFYRPVSTATSCLSLFLENYQPESGFEFVRELREHYAALRQTHQSDESFIANEVFFDGVENAQEDTAGVENYLLNVEYALAVSCEIRLKLYAESDQQNSFAPTENITRFIGKRCRLRTCRSVLYFWLALRQHTDNYNLEGVIASIVQMGIEITSTSYTENDVKILRKFGLEKDAQEIAEELLKTSNSGNLSTDWRVAHDFINVSEQEPSKKQEYVKKAEAILDHIPKEEKSTYEWTIGKAACCFEQNQYDDALRHLDDWLIANKQAHEDDMIYDDLVDVMWLKMHCLRFTSRPNEILAHFNKLFVEYLDPCCQIIAHIGFFFAHAMLKNREEAGKALKQALATYTANAKAVTPSLAMDIHKLFLQIQDYKDLPFSEILTDMVRISNEQIQHFSQGNQQWYSAKHEQRSIAKKFCAEQYSRELVMLIGQSVAASASYTQKLSRVPPHALHRIEVYQGVWDCLLKSYTMLLEGNLFSACNILVSLFKTFQDHLNHPIYLEILRGIIKQCTARRLQLLLPTTFSVQSRDQKASNKPEHQSNKVTGLAYTAAAACIHKLDIRTGVPILWKLIHHANNDGTIVAQSCQVLITSVNFCKFTPVARLLIDQRLHFMSRHCFADPGVNKLKSLYNNAIRDYAEHYYDDSAIALWKIIHNKKYGSCLSLRAIQTLQFVILSMWEEDHFSVDIQNKYVVLRKVEGNRDVGDHSRASTEEFEDIDCYDTLKQTTKDLKEASEDI